ncbi:quinol dehydrogenase ferredoxin subunit NapH [Roseovarius phycicola]|uniref:Quinol dehydrogenase ferredoxin subunit NapH n=1 Tax=Roseovarius phycicola TaxID=3080976 RepID=A0ABZ2HF97_9RHOB
MSARTHLPVGQEAIAIKGWIGAHRFLLLRRASQLFFLALFLVGPWFGIWIVEGTLAGSRTLDILPLTDPFVLVQSMVAGHWPALTALIGAAIVVVAYAVLGGRTYCSWVCPINPVTDAAHWLHVKLGLPKGWQPKRNTRLWIALAAILASALTGTIAWELINPITILHRGLIFGLGFSLALIGLIFLFDLLLSRQGWCGHVCPVGAIYGLIGTKSVVRISAANRTACDDCMDCYAVCPENQVISPALKGKDGTSPLILSPDCTNCGRCIDVCAQDVFHFTHRFDNRIGALADLSSAATIGAASPDNGSTHHAEIN